MRPTSGTGAVLVWTLVCCSCVTRVDLFGDTSADVASCAAAVSAPLGVWQDITPSGISLTDISSNRGIISIASGRPGELFVGTTYQGLWRSRDCGDTWKKIDTGASADTIDTAELIVVVVDPQNSDVLYTTPNFQGGGVWQSSTSGVDWQSILPTTAVATVVGTPYIEIRDIAVDPHDSNHVVATFTSAWIGPMGHSGQDAGVVEGHFDGLNWSWQLHEPGVGMGRQQTITFLADSDSWLIVSRWEGNNFGTWRTINSGASFEKVGDNEYSAAGGQAYRAKDSVVFHTGLTGLFRVENNGATLNDVLGSGTNGVAGDGEQVYASSNDGDGAVEPRIFVGGLSAHLGDFAAFGAADAHSAVSLAIEPRVGALYSATGLIGLRRMRVR
jgi:hypothetical protein